MLLLVTKNTALCEELLSCGVANLSCRADAAIELFRRYDVSGVCCDVSELEDLNEHLLEEILQENADTPVLSYSQDSNSKEKILDFCRAYCKIDRPLQNYYVTVGKSEKEVSFHGYELNVSHSEYKILRLLFLRSPKSTPLHLLLFSCFPNENITEKSLKRILQSLNRKTTFLTGKPIVQQKQGSVILLV